MPAVRVIPVAGEGGITMRSKVLLPFALAIAALPIVSLVTLGILEQFAFFRDRQDIFLRW